MLHALKISSFLFLALLLWRCKQRYDSPYVPPVKGYLVVEGFIAGDAPTKFVLSRVIHLPGDSTIPAVTNAKLQVEGTDNSIYPLTETGPGIYTVQTLPLNPNTRYRLRIATAEGQTYLSDTVAYKASPAIDSISWQQTPDGVTVYANTHDPANATRYYQWSYAETWEYTSAEFSNYKFLANSRSNGLDSVVTRVDSEYIYNCWNGDSSTSILLASTTKLAQDVVYRQKLLFIPRGSIQLSVVYTVNVRQSALSQEAYNFLSLMKSNTESLGSIFDAQPSQLTGNIHNLAHSDEAVIGWVSAGTVQQQRIWIRRSDVPDWGYSYACPIKDTLVADDPGSKSIDQFLAHYQFIPVDRAYAPGIGFIGWYANYAPCIDCRSQGGVTKKPSFWLY